MEPGYEDNATPPVGPNQEARTWAMVAHLSGFVGYFIPFGHLIGPIIVWQMKKHDPFVDDQGKESVNFQLTATLAYIFGFATICLGIGIFIVPAVIIVAIVFMVIAGLQANQGVAYRYPFIIRLIK